MTSRKRLAPLWRSVRRCGPGVKVRESLPGTCGLPVLLKRPALPEGLAQLVFLPCCVVFPPLAVILFFAFPLGLLHALLLRFVDHASHLCLPRSSFEPSRFSMLSSAALAAD